LAAIFARLEFAGLLNIMLLQVKIQATPHSNLAALHSSIAVEWDWLAAVYVCKTYHSFCHPQEFAARKNEV
jgi:hypothetical protein